MRNAARVRVRCHQQPVRLWRSQRKPHCEGGSLMRPIKGFVFKAIDGERRDKRLLNGRRLTLFFFNFFFDFRWASGASDRSLFPRPVFNRPTLDRWQFEFPAKI